MKNRRSRLLRFVVLPIAIAIAAFAIGVIWPMDEYGLGAADKRPLVIDDLSIVDLDAGLVRGGQTIIIVNDRISYAGAAASAPVVPSARRISGAGKYAMPGLWDMHVHTFGLSPQLHFPLLLANGVTSVRDMGDGCSFSGDIDCQPDFPLWGSRPAMLAPRLVATASYHVEEADEGIVQRLKARGDRILKLQLADDIDPVIFHKLVSEGRDAGMLVAGHLPYSVDLLDPRTASLHSIEHDHSLLPQCSLRQSLFDGRTRSKLPLLQLADPARCAAVLAMMARHGVAYVPTHVASSGQDLSLLSAASKDDRHLKYVAWPQRALWRMYAGVHAAGSSEEDLAPLRAWNGAALSLTAQAHASGVQVMAGSDSIDAYVTHGFGLHDELVQLVHAGLTPLDALRAATVVPARHAGKLSDFGGVEAGKIADIVLLNKDPLANIAHAQAIDSVIFNGRLHERRDLDAMLSFVAKQASSFALNCKFLWSMMKP